MITLGPEKAVYSVLLPEVHDILIEPISDFYIHTGDKDRLDELRLSVINKFREWVKDIVDLSDFTYAYPTNGVTHALDQWLLLESGNIHQIPGEYGWLSTQKQSIGDASVSNTRAYISNPFSATGNYHNNYKSSLPMLLDCAFVGSTSKQRMNVPTNVDTITFGFSKGFGLNLFRIGFVFSKNQIGPLNTMMNFNYFNYGSMIIADKIMNNFSVDYIYNKFRSTQVDICAENNLIPSDCVFLATSTDPVYDVYKRGDGTNRICLSREYAKRGLGSFSHLGSM